jgi:hypothetical protein
MDKPLRLYGIVSRTPNHRLLLLGRYLGGGPSGNRYQVNAIAIAATVGNVVSQMRPIQRYGLSGPDAPYDLPVHFRVTEGRPTVLFRLVYKCRKSSAPRSVKEGLARDGIVEGHFALTIALQVGLGLGDKTCLLDEVAGMFGGVSLCSHKRVINRRQCCERSACSM